MLPPSLVSFVIGLDLGQAYDFTALGILKRTLLVDASGEVMRDARNQEIAKYHLVHLVRYQLGTSYPDIVAKVVALLREPRVQAYGRPRLAIDATGVGRPVVDLFLDAQPEAELSPVTITGGTQTVREPWNRTKHISFRVPKVELVSTVQMGLQTGRLTFERALPLAETLSKELTAFQVKVSAAAHESFNARSGAHDDLVLSVALACWLGSMKGKKSITVN